MRILLFICVVLTVANAQQIIRLDYNQCTECNCKPPQNSTDPSLLQHDTAYNCYCVCGKKHAEICTTGECHSGLYCTSPDGETGETAGKGICDDGCNRPDMDCNKYERCEVVDETPTCKCKVYTCTDEIKRPLCAEGNVEFVNRCFYENENCGRVRRKESQIGILGHGTCTNFMNSDSYNPLG